MKRISLLGSTGSIGLNTLDVVKQNPDQFEIVGLAAGTNIELLKKQISDFKPKIVSVATKQLADELKSELTFPVTITYGIDGLIEVATAPNSNFVISAVVGSIGLKPTLAAIEAGKDIGLANKESLVSGGHLVMKAVKEHGVRILPVDSEHSAIFQCLQGEREHDIERLILTASGGAFRHLSRAELHGVTVAEALDHPNWKMGTKLTIDSATMINKGLEVIEAHWLFSIPFSHIDVLIHHESIIHSMVEFKDGAVMAQLGTPDIRVPIQYALSYPGRLELETEKMNLAKMGTLSFFEVDFDRFPGLRLAYEVGELGGTAPTVFNAANEVIVEAFLQGEIPFQEIEGMIEKVVAQHSIEHDPNLEQIIDADQWARAKAMELKNL